MFCSVDHRSLKASPLFSDSVVDQLPHLHRLVHRRIRPRMFPVPPENLHQPPDGSAIVRHLRPLYFFRPSCFQFLRQIEET